MIWQESVLHRCSFDGIEKSAIHPVNNLSHVKKDGIDDRRTQNRGIIFFYS